MDVSRSALDWLRSRPAVGYSLAGLTLGTMFVVLPLVGATRIQEHRNLTLELTGPDVALTVASALVLTQARRRPGASIAVLAAVNMIAIVGGWRLNLAEVALTIVIFLYALNRPRDRAIMATIVTSVSLGFAAVIFAGLMRGEWGRETIVLWLWTATAIALAAQSRRAAMEALEDRALKAEESREETARRRVAEDRVRIARELHDVIAHHVAVMSVQSGVAEHMLERDSGAARVALHHVRASAKSVLSELQSVLGVLRQDENALPTDPAPGIAGLDELIASFRSIGVRVEVQAPAVPPPLTAAADFAASRLVQESLTNVQKHAPGATTTIVIRRVGDRAEVAVVNGPPDPVQVDPVQPGGQIGSGLGLVGMRERVLAAGGSLETGPTADGGFRVEARLPLAQEES